MRLFLSPLALLLGLLLSGSALGQDARIVMFGDSITRAWQSWGNLTRLAPQALDAGVSGDTSQLMLERLDQAVLSHHPQVVVLLAGTNDAYDDAAIHVPLNFSYMREIITRCQAAGARVIVGTIPPLPTAAENAYALRWNAEVVLESHVYGYQVADYYPRFFVDGKKDDSLFVYDLIHPSTEGFLRMWRVLDPLLRGLLGSPNPQR